MEQPEEIDSEEIDLEEIDNFVMITIVECDASKQMYVLFMLFSFLLFTYDFIVN